MVFSKNVADRLMEIYRKLKPTMHLPESQQEWIDAVSYALTRAKHFQPAEFANVTEQIKQEGDMIMSTSVLDYLIAEGKAKGKAEGEAKGETKGEARGKAEGRAETIIRILSRRLQPPSKLLQKKIKTIHSIAKLDELADFALTCVSLEEFATALR
jgi:predicted transposase YdaD